MQNAFIDLISITEAAAVLSYDKIGLGKKELADQMAVNGMECILNDLNISAEVVIGEGDIDNAPQLYLGQKLGKGGEEIEIAVDPIEGTKMVAYNQPNAAAVMAIGKKGTFFKAPDMYMEKLIVRNELKKHIDLEKGIEWNIIKASKILSKPIREIKVATLDKPRHKEMIEKIISMGAKVSLIPDGDVLLTIDLFMNKSFDLIYLVGGSPEGVLNAAITKILGGDMQAKLKLRNKVKENNESNRKIAKEEEEKCKEIGIEINKLLNLNDLVKNEDLIFIASGITTGPILKGVEFLGDKKYSVESIFMRSNTGTISKISSTHDMKKKSEEFQSLMN